MSYTVIPDSNPTARLLSATGGKIRKRPMHAVMNQSAVFLHANIFAEFAGQETNRPLP